MWGFTITTAIMNATKQMGKEEILKMALLRSIEYFIANNLLTNGLKSIQTYHLRYIGEYIYIADRDCEVVTRAPEWVQSMM